jgi:hypothetical protein
MATMNRLVVVFSMDLREQAERNVRSYCSEMNGAEPMAGTADTVDVWVCLEYRPAWKAKAVADNALVEASRNWLAQTLDGLTRLGLKARPQFIRQPESDRSDTRLLVSMNGRAYQFSGQGYGFLEGLNLVEEIRDPDRLARNSTAVDGPLYLVCTNGQRDLCCARYGLPVYAALSERVGERAWQVTHLGGHRFAPNVLCLPDGCLYGRVHPDALDSLLEVTESGEVDFARLRGRTCYPPMVQAAEATLGRPGLRLLHVEGDDALASVRFADASERLEVTVRRADRPMQVLKSCGDEPAEVYPFICD